MTPSKILLGSILLALSIGASATDTHQSATETASLESLDILNVAPCKASGDGTYVEIITTMASVLPPEEADQFLALYCDPCLVKKFMAAKFD
jgi:hypothetical protein